MIFHTATTAGRPYFIRRVYCAQHTPKTHTYDCQGLGNFLSLERRACPPLLHGAHGFDASCARIMRVLTQPLSNPRFLMVVFIVKDTEWVLLGSPLDDGETSSSSSITAELAAGSLEDTCVFWQRKRTRACPSLTLQPSSFSATTLRHATPAPPLDVEIDAEVEEGHGDERREELEGRRGEQEVPGAVELGETFILRNNAFSHHQFPEDDGWSVEKECQNPHRQHLDHCQTSDACWARYLTYRIRWKIKSNERDT